MGGGRGHWGSLSLNNNWLCLWRCRLDWLDRLDRLWLDRLDGSLAWPLASSLLTRPSWRWLLWYLGLLPPAWLSSPTWLATWKTSRLAAWETTLHRSWEATRILAPLVVGLAESQRAAWGPTKDLLGGRGQWLGGSGEHAGKGGAWGARKP